MKQIFDELIENVKRANFTNIMRDEDYKKIAKLDKKLKKDPSNLNLLMQKAYIYADGYDYENTIKTFKQIIGFYSIFEDSLTSKDLIKSSR